MSSRLYDLAARFWQFQRYELPMLAILSGQEVSDNVLFRESLQDHQRRYEGAGSLLHELDEIPTLDLSDQELVTHRLLRHELDTIRRSYEANAHLRPFLFPTGPVFSCLYFANAQTLSTRHDAERYLARLATIPAYLKDFEEGLRAGQMAGIRHPRRVLEAASSSVRASLSGAIRDSPLYGPFARVRGEVNGPLSALAQRAEALIRDEIHCAFERYSEFLAGSLTSGARETVACTDAPGGAEFYEVLLHQFTTTKHSPDEIHRLGLQEVERLAEELKEVAESAGFEKDLSRYRRFLAEDKQFLLPNKEDLRDRIEILCKRIDRLIPTVFGRIPRATYGVELIPEALAPGLPAAYAQPNPADGASSGILWVTSLPAKCPTYQHIPLVLHEGWPGHLMHIALMQEMEGVPEFRRYGGAFKYTACIEGWALYCESVGLDLQLYETPHQHYGRLELEMWRAVRLVVDTGLHAHGWDRSRALDYMRQHLTLPPSAIESEVDRYIALPAQALSYQLGNLCFRALRKRAQAELGDRFALRAFHDRLTSLGAVTLPLLEELVERWITAEKSRP